MSTLLMSDPTALPPKWSLGKELEITGLKNNAGPLRYKLLSLGLIPGVRCKVVRVAPLGDPLQLLLRGGLLSIRQCEFDLLEITPCE